MANTGGAVVVAVARHAERQVVHTLREHGATSSGRAVPLAMSRPGRRRALKRLVRNGSVREAGDRYWLDEGVYEAMRDGRRVRAVFVVIILGAIIAAVIGLGVWQTQTPPAGSDQPVLRSAE